MLNISGSGEILCISSVGLLLLHVPLLYSWCFCSGVSEVFGKIPWGPPGPREAVPDSETMGGAVARSYTDSETCIEV